MCAGRNNSDAQAHRGQNFSKGVEARVASFREAAVERFAIQARGLGQLGDILATPPRALATRRNAAVNSSMSPSFRHSSRYPAATLGFFRVFRRVSSYDRLGFIALPYWLCPDSHLAVSAAATARGLRSMTVR